MSAAPRPDPAVAVELASRIYGLHCAAETLVGEFDDNYALRAVDGRRFVLKHMHRDAAATAVELQCAALERLAATAPDLAVPRVVRTRDAARFHIDGDGRFVWMLSYLPGRPLAHARRRPEALLAGLGASLGRLDRGLAGFAHPAARRDHRWDLSRPLWALDQVGAVADPDRRALARRVLEAFASQVAPRLGSLRRSVIHNDANDHNVLVALGADGDPVAAGILDFGDMLESPTVCDPAIAAAYALLDQPRPLAAVAAWIRGYHAELPLEPAELEVLFPLIRTRLAVSVVNSALRKRQVPGDPYVTVSERPAWEALERLDAVHPRLAHFRLRAACGLEPDPSSAGIVASLHRRQASMVPLLELDAADRYLVVDLGAGSPLLGADPQAAGAGALQRRLDDELKRHGAKIAVGRYDEARLFYGGALFGGDGGVLDRRRTVHLGLDFFAVPGTPVRAPLAGRVRAVADNRTALDYGPVAILEHELDGRRFFTLYGHLDRETLALLEPGAELQAGAIVGRLGDTSVNGGWAPHLHFQLITDLLETGTDFPGVARADERDLWRSLSPDPNAIAGIPAGAFPEAAPTPDDNLTRRRRVLGPNLSVSYDAPLKIVRGFRQYLYDSDGRAYLDVYNNVPHVGHSHPHVVEAIQRQVDLLNTNTRYLHDNLVRYAERLVAKLPPSLAVCWFVNSGSEANELALRLARAHTGRRQLVVLRDAYHGHTTTLVDISPHKFAGPGGSGPPSWVHVAPVPDLYRGPHRREQADAVERYVAEARAVVAGAARDGLCGWIAESLPSVAGQIELPAGYLPAVYAAVREAGGVCIADEVQVGFGRLGTHFWGFETQGVVPDIVVMGKPMGNAHPLAAVVATRAIARSFHNGMEFFSTYGGNPVACAAGLAVLDVLEREDLQANALAVGTHWRDALRELQKRHVLVGDVRGRGLFLGVELVADRAFRTPASAQATYVVRRLRERGILAGVDGPLANVVKLRPPLVFGRRDADLFVEHLNEVLDEDGAAPALAADI